MTYLRPLIISGHNPQAPFARYLIEILAAEGFNAAKILAPEQVRTLPSPQDSGCIVVGHAELGRELREGLLDYVKQGGGLVVMRPEPELAAALGLEPRGSHEGGYIWPATSHPVCPTHLPPRLQFHGGADFYHAPKTAAVATFGSKDEAGASPAVLTGAFGAGRFAVFAYDLAASTLVFHQGRPSQSSTSPSWPGGPGAYYSPAYLFKGMVDVELCRTPQADLQQRILSRLVEWACEPAGPLPRLWYFPDGVRATQFINGDGDMMRHSELLHMIDIMDRYQAPYAVYMMLVDHPKVSPEEVAAWRGRGHSFGQHFWAGPRPSPSELAERITWETDQFRRRYGFGPLSTRHHCVIWAGWMETARALERNGVRLDLNFRAEYEHRDGYVTGSGLPMKFMDESGNFIDVYEQETLTCDDFILIHKSELPTVSVEQATDVSRAYLEDAVQWGHTVVHQYFHPVYARTGWERPFTPPWLEGTLREAKRLGVPALGADAWVHFNDARRATAIEKAVWDPQKRTLSVRVETPEQVPGLTLMVPAKHDGMTASAVTIDGRKDGLHSEDIQGKRYVFLQAPSGADRVEIAYSS